VLVSLKKIRQNKENPLDPVILENPVGFHESADKELAVRRSFVVYIKTWFCVLL
jgi:hypothetical protein